MKKNIKISRFTLVELMMAMAIFTIISMIMMRFFSSAQQVWSKTSQRNELYADARIAMDLIARDLQCALYNNDTTLNSRKGIYPFWFQQVKTINSTSLPLNKYYSDCPITDSIEWTMLNFITATSAPPNVASSSICELRYTFVPMGEIFKNPDGSLIDGGWLVRSCTGDGGNAVAFDIFKSYSLGDIALEGSNIYISLQTANQGHTPSASPTWWALYNAYNFESWYRTTDDPLRTAKIWIRQDATSNVPSAPANSPPLLTMANSSCQVFQKVIPHVYDLKITCYRLDTNNMTTFLPLANADEWGTYFPAAVKIDMILLSKSDWDRWIRAILDNKPELAKTIRLQSQRTFSKTVYLNNKLSL